MIPIAVNEGTVIARVCWEYEETKVKRDVPVYEYQEADPQEAMMPSPLQAMQRALRSWPAPERSPSVVSRNRSMVLEMLAGALLKSVKHSPLDALHPVPTFPRLGASRMLYALSLHTPNTNR